MQAFVVAVGITIPGSVDWDMTRQRLMRADSVVPDSAGRERSSAPARARLE